MKLVLTVLLSTMLINCGGSSTTEPLNADSVNTDGDNNTPEVSALDTLKASNCGQSPDTVKPFYLVVDPYLNSSPLSQNYRLPGTPLISKRCLNSGCEEYSYDSINNMVEVIGTYQPEISKKIYTYNPDNTINVVTTYYADLLSAIDTYTYDNSRLTKTFLDMYNNGIESGILK